MEYFLTGSQVYGIPNKDSDIDIVVKYEDVFYIKRDLIEKGIEYTQVVGGDDLKYPGFYFTVGGIKFNAVVLREEVDRLAWKYATEEMKNIKPIKDTKKRKERFMEFVNEYLDAYEVFKKFNFMEE